jgi:hypothetical protein
MREHHKKNHAEIRAIMKNHDETLVKLINVRTREVILQIIKDYLSQHES